jgi:prevent-host-death family protein
MSEWSIREARDHLSELVAAAQDVPQIINRRGRTAAIVLSEREFKRLQRHAEPLASFFARSELDQIELQRVEASPREDGDL